MKKVTVVILSMLLVLVTAQAAFAKGSVGLTVGYNKILSKGAPGGVVIDLAGDYYLTENLSLAAGVNANIFLINGKYNLGIYSLSLFTKYDLLKTNATTLGLQAGVIDVMISETPNFLFVAPGVYANFNISSKLNLYLNASFPLVMWMPRADMFNFAKDFFYDVKIGAEYGITSNMNLGLEIKISNCKYPLPVVDVLSVGAKIGYTF